jgi:hypothetical protein
MRPINPEVLKRLMASRGAASSDATSVAPVREESVLPGRMLPEVVVEAPYEYTPRSVSPNYLNPFNWGKASTSALKGLNSLAGGRISDAGNPNETYSDLTSRLAQTPGTLQHENEKVNPGINRYIAAAGDVLLDPFNRVPVGSLAKKGFNALSSLSTAYPIVEKTLRTAGVIAPWADRTKDVEETISSYSGYKNKPKIEPVRNDSIQSKIQQLNKSLFPSR